MKHQWLAYVIVGLLSVGAGVAIAGLPDDTPVDATIVVLPTTTVAPDSTEPESSVTTTTAAPTTTEPATTDPETTAATTSVPADPDTTDPDTTDSVPAGLLDRSELFTIVANGSNISGAAARNVERLTALGYTDIAPRNGTSIAEFTTVYFADGLEEEALRLAEDLDLLPEFIAPLAEAPQVLELPADVQLLAYIGIDRA